MTTEKWTKMPEDYFWAVIEESKPKRAPLLSRRHLKLFDARISRLSSEDFLAFVVKRMELAQILYNWRFAGAIWLMNDGIYSDENVLNATGGVIALGRDVYFRMLEDPDTTLAELPESPKLLDCLDFDCLHSDIWARREGEEVADPFPDETYGRGFPSGELPSEESLAERYPKLASIYVT
ncbi:MAG: DUF4240 domain-containing protein [Cyanobacteria bacterium HKST-UBA02]|nr:DUF4240 domain-containing protein [Cyanobacteria bacterium HKST-UBA02]